MFFYHMFCSNKNYDICGFNPYFEEDVQETSKQIEELNYLAILMLMMLMLRKSQKTDRGVWSETILEKQEACSNRTSECLISIWMKLF